MNLHQSQHFPLGIMSRPWGLGIERLLNTIDGRQEKAFSSDSLVGK